MSIIGARMRTPATSVSNVRPNSPSKCDTSVEAPLMLGLTIGMHEHDRGSVDAVGAGALEIAAHGGEVGLDFDRAVGAHALVNLECALVEHFRLDDMARKDLRPRLVSDPQRV